MHADRGGDAFDVEFTASGLTVTVPPGKSILEVAVEVGLDPDYSCREGTCGTCETVVVGGAVEHRDAILTPAEREAGESMMICVSRAAAGCALLQLDA